ncbi:hypothetical protein BKA66DRAFT_407932 [Pyrenochaeta sp. MPI-SDFR-AT-0127]|nr:hypothetical protein BKA66DRAFT_407932 [Pyrenochaeta sp. MPI-SDFR-AT-0127]
MSGSAGLRQNMCGLQPRTLRSEVNEGKIISYLSPRLQYACRYWVYHLKESQSPISDKDLINVFLQKHFLHWLEAISLVRETNQCIRLIKTLYALIKSSRTALFSFLQDAERFTLRFRHILEEAPLQIYSSALLFSPEASIREDAWDACHSTLEGHTNQISAVAFSPDGRCLHTNQGNLPLPSPFFSSLPPQSTQSSCIFIQDQWVSFDQQQVLWLPSEYRPTCATVHKDLVCLGHSSGRLSLLRICKVSV